jgi:lipoprotein-releasing system permease protein
LQLSFSPTLVNESNPSPIFIYRSPKPLLPQGSRASSSPIPIHAHEIQAIHELPGGTDIGQSVFSWSFNSEGGYLAGPGLDPGETVGPGRLSSAVRAGRFLQPGERGLAVADTNYATENHLEIGQTITVSGMTFRLVGLVDTTRAGEVADANIHVPLADAQVLCSAAPNVLAVHDFRSTDAIILFIRADPSQAPALSDQIPAFWEAMRL